MTTIDVRYLDGDRFAVDVRGHRIAVDQPIADGGDDTGPTPTELFVSGLASCVGFYARRYLARHDVPANGLTVSASYEMASRPARVSEVRMVIAVPEGVPQSRRDALLAVASHCTVHNSIVDPPEISIALSREEALQDVSR
jgi:uncharacterized OsmC-like protein